MFTSTDGTNFGTAVATGTGTAAKVTVTFPATTARYVKVVQTGTSTSWWSIAELNVYTNGTTGGGGGSGTVLPRTGWIATASATGGGDVPANALDGNTGTRWSTGTPMVNGQTFTLDLGSAKSFSKLTMDSAGSTNDYAHGYQVFVSTDGTNFGSRDRHRHRHRGAGHGDVPAATARYVKIVQTGTASLVVDRRVQRLLVATGRTTAILVRAARPVVLRVPTSTWPYQ